MRVVPCRARYFGPELRRAGTSCHRVLANVTVGTSARDQSGQGVDLLLLFFQVFYCDSVVHDRFLIFSPLRGSQFSRARGSGPVSSYFQVL